MLRSKVDALDREWVQIRVPKRPNGTIGWVLRDALGGYSVSHQQLTVNRKTFRAVRFARTLPRMAAWLKP